MPDQQDIKLEKAQPIIKDHVLFAAGAGLVLPTVFDILSVTAIQLDMLRQLCNLYEQEYEETRGKAFISSLAGTTLASLAARGVGSLVKMIPFVGTFVGGFSMSIFSGAMTYALGQVMAQHFSAGGSISEFDEEKLKEYYEEQFEKGKEMVKDWKEEIKTTAESVINPETAAEAEVKTDAADAAADMTTPQATSAPSPAEIIAEQISNAQDLLDKGLITPFEFERIKKRIMKQKG